eukprot:m.239993 g.239993  ORF g.239993 m.239993 type:complete len:384 (-) comp18985_c1_seq2:7-1158(-)
MGGFAGTTVACVATAVACCGLFWLYVTSVSHEGLPVALTPSCPPPPSAATSVAAARARAGLASRPQPEATQPPSSIVLVPVAVGSGKPGGSALSAATLSQALRDSLGFIDDTEANWALRQQACRSQQRRQVKQAAANADAVRYFGRSTSYYQENWEPNFSCAAEKRLGVMGDGGKWVCDPDRIDKKRCLVYSVGSNNEFSFERAVLGEISPDCEVFTFDPTVGAKPRNQPPAVQFRPWAVANRDAEVTVAGPNRRRIKARGLQLSSMVRELGHANRTIDILKIDCEGCEWSTFRTWLGQGFIIRQILVEVHDWGAGKPPHDFFLHFAKAGYVIFHKEPNTMWSGGKCVEFAFLLMDPSFCPADTIPPMFWKPPPPRRTPIGRG